MGYRVIDENWAIQGMEFTCIKGPLMKFGHRSMQKCSEDEKNHQLGERRKFGQEQGPIHPNRREKGGERPYLEGLRGVRTMIVELDPQKIKIEKAKKFSSLIYTI